MVRANSPHVSIDIKGTVRVVYGSEDKLYCATSTDHGTNFSKPVLVVAIEGMHLGMGGGPQLSCSANYSVITAMDKTGSIHWYQMSHKIGN